MNYIRLFVLSYMYNYNTYMTLVITVRSSGSHSTIQSCIVHVLCMEIRVHILLKVCVVHVHVHVHT